MLDQNGIGTALKLWLIFFLSFFLLGYPAPLAILWAVVGSLAGGVIASQVNIKTPPPMAKPIDKPGEESGRFNWRKRLQEGNVGFFSTWGRSPNRSFKTRR